MFTTRRLALTASLFIVLFLTTTSFAATEEKYRLGSAKGNGTLKVGAEEFKITSVVIKLMENGKAEINLISEITVFISGTWSRSANANEINIQITGDASAGSFEGSGKLLLRDRKTIDRLTLQGTARTSKRQIEINFVAE
jgi:hypothetical protein